MAVQRVWRKLTFWINYIEKKQKDFSRSFGAAWFFTMLLSACNGRSGNVRSENGTGKEPGGLKTEAYLNCIYQNSGETRQSFYSTKTVNCSEICESQSFLWQRRRVIDLKEMFFNSGKYLISGIGELEKQNSCVSLSWIEQEEVKCRIAAVQYEENLAVSFSRSFLNLTGESVEERFHEGIYHLSEEHQKNSAFSG